MLQLTVELVRFVPALDQNVFEPLQGSIDAKPSPETGSGLSRDICLEFKSCLGAALLRIHRLGLTVDNEAVKGVFRVADFLTGRFVVTKYQFSGVASQPEALEFGMIKADCIIFCRKCGGLRLGCETPGIAKPELDHQGEGVLFLCMVGNRNLNEDIINLGLGVLYENIEVAALGKDAGIGQFIFGLVGSAPAVFLLKLGIGKGCLRVFVEHLAVGMRRQGIEEIVYLFYVLAVIALRVRQAKQAFFEDRVPAVPQGQADTDLLLLITEAGQAILTPAIGPLARLIMGQIIPRLPVDGIVFTNGAPLPLTEIWSPSIPVFFPRLLLLQTLSFDGLRQGRRVGAAFSYHGTQPVLLPQDRSLAPGPYGNRFIGKFKDLFNNMVIMDA